MAILTSFTHIGVADGTDEGYAAPSDVAASVLGAADASGLPATDPTGSGGASTQDALNNLNAAISAAANDDVSGVSVAVNAGSLEVTVTEGGTPYTGSVALSAIAGDLATAIAGDAAAMQTLAAAIRSPDTRNTIFIASTDGLLAENDSGIY